MAEMANGPIEVKVEDAGLSAEEIVVCEREKPPAPAVEAPAPLVEAPVGVGGCYEIRDGIRVRVG